MRSAETKTTCEHCGRVAEYCDSIPDATITGTHPSECGYRLQALCWVHAVERRQVATSRVAQLLVCGDVGRLDRERCGGDCVCEDCGKTYYRHPVCPEFPFLHVLCDGSVVKL